MVSALLLMIPSIGPTAPLLKGHCRATASSNLAVVL